MYHKITITILLAILPVLLIGQDDGILPNQVTNIKRLAYRIGFTENTLAAYVHQVYGESISELSQEEGANLIRSFLSDSKPKPLTSDVTGSSKWAPVKEFLSERKDNEAKPVRRVPDASPEPVIVPDTEPEIAPVIASILEVGMEKRFHLLDGNIIQGTIIKKEDGISQIETIDGILRVPDDAILEETAHIVKKEDTRYVGPVLKETPEEIVIKIEISGIKVEDVTVTLEGNKLMLTGKRYDRDKRVKRVFKQMEINYGKFERTIELHSYFDPKATRASYKNGYLEIVLRKVKKARKLNKPIQINFSK